MSILNEFFRDIVSPLRNLYRGSVPVGLDRFQCRFAKLTTSNGRAYGKRQKSVYEGVERQAMCVRCLGEQAHWGKAR